MLSSPLVVRTLSIAGSATILASLLIAGQPASALTVPATRTSVTVLLKAPDPTALARLASSHNLSHAERLSALAAVSPSAAAHRSVANRLAAAGFHITHETAWTIDAAAPTPTVTSTFGAPPAVSADASPLARVRASGVLPIVPAAIADVTAAVLTNGTGPAVFAPRGLCPIQCHDGTDFRNAYSSTSHVLGKGYDRNGALTIATLQFPYDGGWNDSDLTKYAAAHGLPDPVATGQYTQIPVDGTTVPPATTDESGADEEVDLDQETILSTSPDSNQRAYFDTNSSKAGYADALSQVLADVTEGHGAVAGGDPKIVALSTSWGACESEFDDGFAFDHDTVTAVGNILTALTAAGVTVFAASGDDGVYDCGDSTASTRIAVDYPASSPQVVAVGGTRLKAKSPKAANNGSNWTDTAWTCTSAQTCQGTKPGDTGGSGGGESKLFAQPAYQAAGIGHHPFITSTGKHGDLGEQPHRLVPDISADGDPTTGFSILTSDPVDAPNCAPPNDITTCKANSFPIGGTSLSAPATAAMFTDMLAAHGVTHGVGDIHNALYSAYAAHRHAFRDITSGRNGNQHDLDRHATKGTGAELPVTALKGYDTVTGLGAPLWPSLAPYIFTPTAPRSTGTLRLTTPHHRHRPTRITAAWGAKLAATGASAGATARVTISRAGRKTPIYRRNAAPANGSHTFLGRAGATYTMTVRVTDLAGQRAPAISRSLVVPYDDRHFTFHGVWLSRPSHRDVGGSHATTDANGAFAKAIATGRIYTIEARTGPSYGLMEIAHGSTVLATKDLYSPHDGRTLITFFGTAATTVRQRTFTFRCAGRKARSSTGTTIGVDALIVRR